MNETAQTTAIAHSYPPPPWTLAGSVLVASFAVRATDVAEHVPAPLELVRLPGGFAVAYLAFGRYGPGSTLHYSELIAGVLVRYRARVSFYVTNIAVDNASSQRGGIEIWHLPKQLWQFEWNLHGPQAALRVWDSHTLVCTARDIPLYTRLWPVKVNVPFLHHTGQNIAQMPAQFDLRMRQARWHFQVAADGPLAHFAPVGPAITTVARGSMVVQPLQAIGK